VIPLVLFAGLVLLVLGGELLVRGASKLAVSLGLSPLVVGLTVVAFGTSAPELAVSVQAVLAGQTDIAMGNVVGSNILNVLLILGVSALIVPLVVAGKMIRKGVPVMVGTSLLLIVLALDGNISQLEGGVLVMLLIGYTIMLIRQSRRETAALREQYAREIHIEHPEHKKVWDDYLLAQIGLIVAGLVLLLLGARWLVDGAIAIATALGVSELIIGLTIVAIGTSLPEAAASIAAAVKGQRDIAVGNVVGSNILNVLCVVGFAAVSSPIGLAVGRSLLEFDMLVMLAVAIACLPIFFTGNVISRWEGGVFLGYYAAYTVYLALSSLSHWAVDRFALLMLGFVVPLTALTLVVVSVRTLRAQHDVATT
jgi:cation:H+ antiporter